MAEEQESKGEIQQADIKDGGKTIEVYNSEVNGINTCMTTSASYGRRRIFTAIGNNYSYTWFFGDLPYYARSDAFYTHYTLTQHAMSYVYNWVTNVFDRSNPNTYTAIKVSEWPIGLEAGFDNYLSYYGPDAHDHNFEKHNLYWQQYTAILWDQNPSLHQKFNNDLSAFQSFYYRNELQYIGQDYLGNIDLSTLPSNQGAIAVATISSSSFQHGTTSVSGIGDVNGDYIPDLLIGVFNQSSTPVGVERDFTAFVVYGGQGGIIDLSTLPSSQGFVVKSSVSFFERNFIVRGTGDINGDGIADFLLTGSNLDSDPDNPRGFVYIIYGGQSGIIDVNSLRSAQGVTIKAPQDDFELTADGTGDMNGDGFPDLVIGVTGWRWVDGPYTGFGGKVYVVYGGQSGTIDLTFFPNNQGFVIVYPVTFPTTDPIPEIGFSVSGTGDINRDGVPDLILASRSCDNGFKRIAYVVYGGHSGTIDLSLFPNNQGFVIEYSGLSGCGSYTTEVMGVGDINGDRVPDLFVKVDRSFDVFEAFLVYGGQINNGIIDLDKFPNSQGFKIVLNIYSYDGSSISWLGDVNADGFADLLVGFSDYAVNANTDVAKAYVVYGGQNGMIDLATFPSYQGFVIEHPLHSADTPPPLSGTGDINLDGIPDILLGFPVDEYCCNDPDCVYYCERPTLSYLVYGSPSPGLLASENDKIDKHDLPAYNSLKREEKREVYERKFLSFSNMVGQQFNVFYQQAKDYLASFWRAEPFQVKTKLSVEQIIKRERALDKTVKKLDLLETVLDLEWHDNKDYLKKVIRFYQKMLADWRKDVSTLMAQDIRDLQEDISKISQAVYSLDVPYPVRKAEQKTPYGFFTGAGVNTSVNYPALGAQPIGLLP